jgi:enoyl-CoA hydratase
MDFEILKLDLSKGIAIITISRPEAMNALNSRFFSEMNEMLDNIENREDIKVMILTGEGKAFVAGADIAEMVDKNAEEGKEFSKSGHATFKRIENLPFPVIAAVNGFALGGGCELALACDFRVASTYAKFGQPEVNLGLIPGYGGTQRLPRIAGLSNALYMVLTGEMIDANKALNMGIVQAVFEAESLMEETMALAKKISYKGPVSVRKAKEVIRKGMLSDFDGACRRESNEFAALFGNGESGEGMKAFLEKRKPEW